MLGFSWPFGKKNNSETENIPDLEDKSFALGAFTGFLSDRGQNDLAAITAIQLFNITAPLNNAVDILASEVAALIPQVVSKKNKDDVFPEHPVLKLLETPNTDSTTNELLYGITAFFLITGNSYLIATGQVNKPPLELTITFPQRITVQSGAKDGLPELMTDQTNFGSIDFKREEVDRRFRFYNDDSREIWQIKRFNPNVQQLIGQSLSTSILREIDQYNQSSIHNLSLLKRGGRPSGILMMNALKGKDGVIVPPATDAQKERLKEHLDNFIAGAENAGKILAVSGTNMKWENLITTNRDMDFATLKKDVRNMIYNQFGIPLPFVNPEDQTFANMGLAKEQLYDNAVIPLADRIFNELNIFLMPRYGSTERDKKLTYNASIIPALQNRKTRETEKRKKIGVFTDNELRGQLGFEPYDGGDVVYKPANEVPVGQDAYTGDEPVVPKNTKK